MHELILGGGRSGMSRCAELRAHDWLRVSGQCAPLIATAAPADDEMRERISGRREQRALHVPDLQTLKVPYDLPAALRERCAPQRLVIVDCLAVWSTRQSMSMAGPQMNEPAWLQQEADLCNALGNAAGPVVLVSNEIGMGVAPLGGEVRRYLDAVCALHQRVMTFCERVTLMVAGIEMKVKE